MEHSLNYKDYFKKIYELLTENGIADMEINRGQTVYIETYCIEMHAFPTQFDAPRKKDNNIGFDA